MRFLSPFITLLLTPLLVVSSVSAQLPVAAPASETAGAPSQDLQLRLLESEGFQAQTGALSEKGIAVVVTNEAGQGIPNAAVVLRMPDTGTTGTFKDVTHAEVAYTDESGIARFGSIQWGGSEGLMAARVTASKGSSHAGMLLEYTLSRSTAIVAPATAPAVTTAATLAPPKIKIPDQAPATAAYVPPRPDAPPPPAPGALATKTQPGAAGLSAPRVSVSSPAANSEVPLVSVTSASPDTKIHSGSKAKWIVIAAVAAGAGIGAAMAMGKGKAGSTATATPGISIGSPSVSVGNP